MVTVEDWVEAQARLADASASTLGRGDGRRLGAMQALQWTLYYPDRIRHAHRHRRRARLSAQNIAFNEVARQAITTDPDFHGGDYYAARRGAERGLRLARMIGHITYLSDDAMTEKFGRQLRGRQLGFLQLRRRVRGRVLPALPGRQVLRVLRRQHLPADHQGARLLRSGGERGGDLAAALAPGQGEFLVVSFTTDWRFSPARSREIVKALVDNRHESPTPRSTRRTGTTRSCWRTRATTRCRAYYNVAANIRPRRRRRAVLDNGAAARARRRRRAAAPPDFDAIAGWIAPGRRCSTSAAATAAAALPRTRGRDGLRHRDRRRQRARVRAERRERDPERPRARAAGLRPTAPSTT